MVLFSRRILSLSKAHRDSKQVISVRTWITWFIVFPKVVTIGFQIESISKKEQTVTVVQNDVSAKRLITATICPSNITQLFFCKKPRSSHLRSRNERANELRASVSTRLVCEKLCRRAYERAYHELSVLTTKEHGKA